MNALPRRSALSLATAVLGLAVPASAMSAPSVVADVELIRLCAEFDAIERRHHEVFITESRRNNEDAADAAMDAMIEEHEPLLDRITALSPTTIEGASALAATLQGWSHGDFARGGLTEDRLAGTLVEGLARLAPSAGLLTLKRVNPDAGLLALRPRLEAAVADVGASEMASLPDGASEEEGEQLNDWVSASGAELYAVCNAIVSAPPAHTAEGRALKAAAAMHELCFSSCNGEWPGPGEEFAWLTLSEIAGPVYVPVTVPEHLRVTEPRRA